MVAWGITKWSTVLLYPYQWFMQILTVGNILVPIAKYRILKIQYWFGAIRQPVGQFPQQAQHPCQPLSNRQSLISNHTLLFPLFQQTMRPLFSLFLNPCSPSSFTCSPHISPEGLSNILHHNCALFCYGFCKSPLCKHLFFLRPVVDTGFRQNRCLHSGLLQKHQVPLWLMLDCWSPRALGKSLQWTRGMKWMNECINSYLSFIISLIQLRRPTLANPKTFAADHHTNNLKPLLRSIP